jgi:signal transduction histidine kinase
MDRVASSLRHEQRLSAELSHELRTPLSRIVAESELLARRDRPLDERHEAYASIGRSAEQMSAILETLMAAARADAGLDRGRSELGAVLRGLEATWGAACRARGQVLHLAAPAEAVGVGVVAEVVERILTPILDNAVRHARHAVRVTVGETDGRATITVADDGAGLAAEDRARVFEPGVRLDAADGHDGSGLGLPLARRLARAAGGDVHATSAPGGGAAFVVALPR